METKVRGDGGIVYFIGRLHVYHNSSCYDIDGDALAQDDEHPWKVKHPDVEDYLASFRTWQEARAFCVGFEFREACEAGGCVDLLRKVLGDE